MKIILLLMLMSLTAEAKNILINLNGEQQLVHAGFAGGVTPDAQIVWDEYVDGNLPNPELVGFAKRIGNTLVQDDALKVSYDAKVAAKIAEQNAKLAEKAEFDLLKAKIKDETATATEIRKAFKHLLKKLGE